MSEGFKILLTSSVTVVVAVLVLVIGQLLQEFCLDPIYEQAKHIGEIRLPQKR